MSRTFAPFIRTKETHNFISLDFAVALVPIIVWSVFMFGARVLSLAVIAIISAGTLDYLAQRFIFRREKGVRIDISASVFSVLAVMMMPVSAPLWLPIVSSLAVVLAKNLRVIRAKRLFNPFVFSAFLLNFTFPDIMTAFTKPFAYFSAFDINIDPILINNYRVTSPLQYMADGSVYEDGVLAQLYGFASGCIGEIAVFAIIIAAVWLFARKVADPSITIAMLFPILILALIFPSDDAESAFYAYSIVLSGAIVFLSVFALNESCTVPQTKIGKLIFGFVCGCTVFAARKFMGGYEWGYAIILLLNVSAPFIDTFARKYLRAK